MTRPGRILLLTLTLWLASSASILITEPCFITYPVWRASLRFGSAGLQFRQLSFVQSGLEACDERYR